MSSHNQAYIYPDTNVLLECRNLRNLPWQEVAPNSEKIWLVLTMAVISEIDRAAYDGRELQRRKARKTKELIRPLVQADKNSLELSGNTTLIIITCSPSWQDGMDKENIDDRILAEVLAHSIDEKNKKIVVTHETVMGLKLKTYRELEYFPVPDEWIEPRDEVKILKKVKDLEAKVASLTNHRPKLEVSIFCPDRKQEPTLIVHTSNFSELQESDVEAIVESERRRLLIETPEYLQITLHSKRSRERYLQDIVSYNKNIEGEYLEKYREYLSRLVSYLKERERRVSLRVELENIGGAPAEGLTLEIRPSSNSHIARKDKKLLPSPPDPPSKPKIRRLDDASIFDYSDIRRDSYFNEPLRIPSHKPRDPRAFYWSRDPIVYSELGKSLTVSCDEFIHGGQPKMLDFYLRITPEQKGGSITVEASASNLPKRVKQELQFRVEQEKEITDPLAHVTALLEEDEI